MDHGPMPYGLSFIPQTGNLGKEERDAVCALTSMILYVGTNDE